MDKRDDGLEVFRSMEESKVDNILEECVDEITER